LSGLTKSYHAYRRIEEAEMNPLNIFLALYFEDSNTKFILERKSEQRNTKAMIVEFIYEEDNTLDIYNRFFRPTMLF
jgi:hypothetical protein